MKHQALSWRGLSETTFWDDFPQAIVPTGKPGRKSWEVYDHGQIVGIRDSFADATALLPQVSAWSQIDLPRILTHHYYFGPTTEFTEPRFIWVPKWAAFLTNLDTLADAEDDKKRGSMVSITVPPEIAEQIVLDHPDAEPVEDMHITLGYLGKDVPNDEIRPVLARMAELAASMAPFEITLNGFGCFVNDDEKPLFIIPNAYEIVPLRWKVDAMCEEAGLPISKKHGFCPHITLAYLSKDDPLPIDGSMFNPLSWTCDTLTVEWGKDTFDFPLGGRQAEASRTRTMWQGFYVGEFEGRLHNGINREAVFEDGDSIALQAVSQRSLDQMWYPDPSVATVEAWPNEPGVGWRMGMVLTAEVPEHALLTASESLAHQVEQGTVVTVTGAHFIIGYQDEDGNYLAHHRVDSAMPSVSLVVE